MVFIDKCSNIDMVGDERKSKQGEYLWWFQNLPQEKIASIVVIKKDADNLRNY